MATARSGAHARDASCTLGRHYNHPVRIFVTNDDGIDSTGLHVLARALKSVGDVVVVAPDQEYSGYGAAFGPLHLLKPEVHRRDIDGIDEAWAVTGPPALCVMFGRLGLFGHHDLVVAGINPGANVGRSVYHSGTVGACLTARNGGLSGVAVSQSVEMFGVEGQGFDEVLSYQLWDTAATVASTVVSAIAERIPEDPIVLNVNVPNSELHELKGWKRTELGMQPPRSMTTARLEPRPGHEDSFRVKMKWGEAQVLPEHSDGGAVMSGWVSLGWLGRLETVVPDHECATRTEVRLTELLN